MGWRTAAIATTSMTNGHPEPGTGTYYVFVAANLDYSVNHYSWAQPESDAGDNIVSGGTLTITAPAVNLTVINPVVNDGAGTPVVTQQSIPISFDVKNTGTATANASEWYDAVYYSTHSSFDSSAVFLTSIYHDNSSPPLAGGDVSNVSTDIGINVAGSYYLYFVANYDAANTTQGESNYSDNVSGPLAITVNAPSLTTSVEA